MHANVSRGDELARLLERPQHHPKATHQETLLFTVLLSFAGFIIGTLVCLNVESIRQFLSWLTSTELFSPELYFLSKLPAEMDPGETFAVLAMALALSLLATLYPSWRAARLDPIEALRYE